MQFALAPAPQRGALHAIALACLLSIGAPAAAADAAPTAADFRKLLERVEQLERRNRELESRLDGAGSADARTTSRLPAIISPETERAVPESAIRAASFSLSVVLSRRKREWLTLLHRPRGEAFATAEI